MTRQPTQIADAVVVTIEYTLKVDGEIIDSSEEAGPLEYLQGHDNIVSGLEKALAGKQVGDSLQVAVGPADAYGAYDDEAVAFVPRLEMPADIPLEEGIEIMMEDDDGDYLNAVITWVGADEIKLDFNHPLAGRALEFDVKITGLRAPNAEELDHGHVHVEGHDHG